MEDATLLAIATGQCEGANGRLLGLPLDCFLRIAVFASQGRQQGRLELLYLSHVCSAWRRTLLGFPALWTNVCVDLASLDCLDPLRAWADRGKGGMKTLELVCNRPDEDLGLDLASLPVQATTKVRAAQAPSQRTVLTLEQLVFNEISVRDGARNLRRISINLAAYGDDEGNVNRLLEMLLNFCQYAAVSLADLTIVTALQIPVSPIFATCLALRTLEVVSANQAAPGHVNNFPVNALVGESQVVSSPIESLSIYGALLADPVFPSFSRLTTLGLFNLTISNLYGLLEKTPALRKLVLGNVKPDPRAAPAAADQDLPAILQLDELREAVFGGSSSNLWSSGTPSAGTASDILIHAPLLQAISYAGGEVDLLSDLEEERGDCECCSANVTLTEFAPNYRLTTQSLTALLRTSPLLAALNLNRTGLPLSSLFDALATPNRLTHLHLCETASDVLLAALDRLVPHLEYLDVRECNGYSGEHIPVTLPELARLAQRYVALERGVPLVLVVDEGSMGYDEMGGPTTEPLRRMELGLLITALSHNQVEHVIHSFPYNPPPYATPYETVQQEVRNFSIAPKRLSDKGEVVYGRGSNTVASLAKVREAKDALARWQGLKEELGAVEYCRVAEGVELLYEDPKKGRLGNISMQRGGP